LSIERYSPEEPQSFEETVNGTIHQVTAKFDNGVAISWTIDAAKDYSPLKCVLSQNDKILRSVECDYEQFEGTWFSIQAIFFENGIEISRIQVNDASFSTDDDARPLSPNDLGIFPGTTISREKEPYSKMWDGEKCVSLKDYFDAVKAGKVNNKEYENYLRRTEKGGQGSRPKKFDDSTYGLVDVERTPGLWVEYVRRFIRKNRLDTATSRKAWRVHKACQTDALKYLKTQRGAIDELDRELEKARAGGESERNAVKAAEARRERKLGPVVKIFEDRLRPGLTKLVKTKEPAATAATPVSPATGP